MGSLEHRLEPDAMGMPGPSGRVQQAGMKGAGAWARPPDSLPGTLFSARRYQPASGVRILAMSGPNGRLTGFPHGASARFAYNFNPTTLVRAEHPGYQRHPHPGLTAHRVFGGLGEAVWKLRGRVRGLPEL